MTTTLTQRAVQRLFEIRRSTPTPELEAKAATCLLDFLASVIGGLQAPWAAAALTYARTRTGSPEAHAWGLEGGVAAETAAFSNGCIGHSLIRDDMHLMSATHIGVLVLPAALALAQRDGWSGAQLLRGILAGYDMATHLGVAVRTGNFNQHFRPSGINGPFGAAAAAIAASTVDADVGTAALGFAANSTAGVNEWPWAGGQEVNTHAGNAARLGLAAFDIACAGVRSSMSVLEGRDGLFAALGNGKAGAELFEQRLQGPPGILEVRHKPFAGCNLIQTPIATSIEVHSQLAGRTDEIQSVTIRTFAQAQSYPGCDNQGPFTKVQQSKMSLQYGVCSALVSGRADEDTYIDFTNHELKRLIALTSIEIEPTYLQSLMRGQQPAEITVTLQNGTTKSAYLNDVPWLDDASVEARFRKEAAACLAPEAIQTIVEIAQNLERQSDLMPLFQAFSSSTPSKVART